MAKRTGEFRLEISKPENDVQYLDAKQWKKKDQMRCHTISHRL